MKSHLLLVLFVLLCSISKAQTIEFSGKIVGQDSIPISGASIILKDSIRILSFGYSNETGDYLISLKKDKLFEIILEVNSLGSEKKERVISITDKKLYKNDFQLQDEIESLSTIVISSDKKIDLKKDTIVYKVSRFSDKTERTVEDVLKNIPGIEIDENGTIKAQGQNIQKILIEGDDLANSNYKVISQNLDAKVLDKVEVISNYDENPVLKQFLSSNAVVLNLKLQEDAKSVLFGNIEGGAGVENRYLVDLNLGLIRPEIKFLNLGNINNTGKTAGDQLNNYIFRRQGFNDFNQNFEMKNDPPVHLTGSSIMLEDQFYIENNTFANNLLLNKTFKEKSKLRASLFFYDDTFEKEYTGFYEYFIEPENIKFTEENAFHSNNLNISNEIEISHPISEDDYLSFNNSLKLLNERSQNLLLFNNEGIIDQNLKNKHLNLESNLKYTRKLQGGAAIFYLYLGSKNLDQDFTITPNNFIEEPEISTLFSFNESNINYQGFQTDFIFKKKRLSYSITGGIRNLSEVLNSNVPNSVNQTEISLDSLSGQNKANSLTTNLKVKADYQLSRYTHFEANIDAVNNYYKNNGNTENFLFINPQLNFSTRTRFGNMRFGYSFDSEIPSLRSFLDNYLILNYRTLRTGTNEIEKISKHRYSFVHTYSRPEERILFSSSISFTDFENQLGTTSFISRDLNVSKFNYVEGQNFIILNSGFTTYVDNISSTIKIGITHTLFESPSTINNQALVIKNQTSSIYLRGTTYFKGAYNMKFSANYSIVSGKVQGNEVTNERYNLRFENILKFSNRIFGNFKNELYLIESQLYESSTAEVELRPKESNWVIGLRAQNLFNTNDYVFTSVNDYQSTEKKFKSVPRYLMFYLKLRF